MSDSEEATEAYVKWSDYADSPDEWTDTAVQILPGGWLYLHPRSKAYPPHMFDEIDYNVEERREARTEIND